VFIVFGGTNIQGLVWVSVHGYAQGGVQTVVWFWFALRWKETHVQGTEGSKDQGRHIIVCLIMPGSDFDLLDRISSVQIKCRLTNCGQSLVTEMQVRLSIEYQPCLLQTDLDLLLRPVIFTDCCAQLDAYP